MIRKAVIPAAGLGTRFFPITKSQPKEMLPIVDKPCIQYIVEEAIKSGIKEIIIITNGDKGAIQNYFTPNAKLNSLLKKKKKFSELRELKKVENLAKFTFVKQSKPLGDGHAILCAKHLLKNESFAVLFPDDIYDSSVPPLKQLLEQYKKYNAPIVGLQKIDKKDSTKYGIVKLEKNKIIDLIEKPTPQNAPSNLAIVGKYIVTPKLMKALQKAKSSTSDKELRLIDGMKKFVKKGGALYGLQLKGHRFDTGEKSGYLKAVIHFATQKS